MFGGTLAAQQKGMPILLVEKDNISDAVLKELERLEIKKVYILGGESAISEKAEKMLDKYTVKRLAGRNRHDTAFQINSERIRLYEGKDTVIYGGDYSSYIIASGTDFADALAAAPYIGQLEYDISGGSEVEKYPQSFYRFIPSYSPDQMAYFIIGGPSEVPLSARAEAELKAVGTGIRIAGKNRYGTAVEIAKLYPKSLKKTVNTVILASGLDYPDALAAALLIGTQDAALLLTHPKALSKETKDYLVENKIRNVILLGGENAVSEAVVEDLQEIEFK